MEKKYFKFLNSPSFFILLIILLVLILYLRTISFGLIFLDDDTLVYNKFAEMSLNEQITSSFTSNFLSGHYYRPITLFSFILDSFIGGQSYFIYHLTNLLIHLLTSVLVFLIIRKFGHSILNSFFIASLFALNPIHINAVGWIAGRGDLLAAFFSAAALLIYLKFIKQNKLLLLFLVSTFLFLALLSKEVSLLVPFLLLGLYFIEKKELSLDKNSIGVFLMIVIVFGFYYLLRGIFLSGVHIDKFSFTTYYKNILILPETISKFFIPIGIKVLPSIETFTSISGVIIFILLLLIPFKFNSINKYRYYFGLLWFIFLLIPGMVFRTMEQDGFYYWDCRSYLPSIGLVFMVAEIVRVIDLQKCKNLCFTFIVIYFLILSGFTFIQIKLYENPITYWNAVKVDYPNRFLPYVGLYNYYNHKGDKQKSEKQLLSAIKISPSELSVRELLVNFYLKQSESNKAFDLLKNTLIDKRIYTNSLIEKYISLSVEFNKNEEINNLVASYKDDNNVIREINKIKSRLNL